MAVQLITTHLRHIGLSTDTKPVGMPVGTEFYEYNSGQKWVTYDGTNYAQELDPPEWTMENSLEDM